MKKLTIFDILDNGLKEVLKLNDTQYEEFLTDIQDNELDALMTVLEDKATFADKRIILNAVKRIKEKVNE